MLSIGHTAQGEIDDHVCWIIAQLDLTAGVRLDITAEIVDKNYWDFIKLSSNCTFAYSGNITLSHEINSMTMIFFMNYYEEIKKAYAHILDVVTCMKITNLNQQSRATSSRFDQAISGIKIGSSKKPSTSPSAAAKSARCLV
ncbi:hypothetical protein G6F43_009184 [Rhizopus delemar]|nr:hypothetical protein G6F43_009184 [Rhizopus delemar]